METAEKECKTHELRSVVEPLRLGHGLLSREQFVRALMSKQFEIWRLPSGVYALVSWSDSEVGPCCHVMTVCNMDESATHKRIVEGLEALEKVAKENGAKMLLSFGRAAYRSAALDCGYTVTPGIFMRKVLK